MILIGITVRGRIRTLVLRKYEKTISQRYQQLARYPYDVVGNTLSFSLET